MVDAVVSYVIQRLGDYLIQEVVSLRGVRDDVQWLKNRLEWSQCFLQDAQRKQDGDHRIRKWVSDVSGAAYSAEDVIDDFILKVEDEDPSKRRGLGKYIRKGNKLEDLYHIRNEIEALRHLFDEIHRNQEIFNIRNIGDAGEGSSRKNKEIRELRRSSPYADDDEEVVGFKSDAEFLLSLLLKEEPYRCVISILGMGGLGKTTLARKLYNNSSVKGWFPHHAWVCVSQVYKTRDLLQSIIKSFRMPTTNEELKMLKNMTEEDLERHLHQLLGRDRYLVVIDDLWEIEAWESLRKAFPDSKNGSRVIITTRIRAVAERSYDRTYVYQLPYLNEEESWELFCKKAFRNDNVVSAEASRCSPSLEKLGREMVKKCGGLPLAIVVLGGLLSRKQHDEWHKVRDNMWRHVRDGSVHVMLILTLSFCDLPSQLKSCFLYIGLFPEDFEIQTEKLLQLWMAEGFIQSGDQTLEEMAMEYLNELIDRNLIQVTRRNWRRIAECRVHDLLRDLAIEKAKEVNFFHIYEKTIQCLTISPSGFTHRRLACSHLEFERFVSSYSSNSCLRTLLIFNPGGFEPIIEIDWLASIHKKYRLLRVLDLQGTWFKSSVSTGRIRLPDEVGKLIHLRYLGLRGIKICELPPSIGNLRALQTLDVYTSEYRLLLPKEIGNLTLLRHLIGWEIKWPFQVNNLTDLRILKSLTVDDWMQFDSMNLINLQELWVNGIGRGFTLDSIGKLRNLQTLHLDLLGPVSLSTLQPLTRCENLVQLRFTGSIRKLPTWMNEFLPNLKFLYLRVCNMEEDPMPTLEKLPNLTILVLVNYEGKELVCTAGGFSQLKVLQLTWCNVRELRVDEGGMPVLESFTCDSLLMRIPIRICSIPASTNPYDPHSPMEWPY